MTKCDRECAEIDATLIKLCLDMILTCRPEKSQLEKDVAEASLNVLLDYLIDLIAKLNT